MLIAAAPRTDPSNSSRSVPRERGRLDAFPVGKGAYFASRAMGAENTIPALATRGSAPTRRRSRTEYPIDAEPSRPRHRLLVEDLWSGYGPPSKNFLEPGSAEVPAVKNKRIVLADERGLGGRRHESPSPVTRKIMTEVHR